MTKKLIIFLLYTFIFIGNGSCIIFEDCDGSRYQIKKVVQQGNDMCLFRAESITECLIWNDQKYIEFIDSCHVYTMSDIRDRDEFYKKYGK